MKFLFFLLSETNTKIQCNWKLTVWSVLQFGVVVFGSNQSESNALNDVVDNFTRIEANTRRKEQQLYKCVYTSTHN